MSSDFDIISLLPMHTFWYGNDDREYIKSINDYIIFKDNNNYNYIVLCDLTYDEKLLKNINFNKNINYLVSKIQKNFLKKYKNEYKYRKIK